MIAADAPILLAGLLPAIRHHHDLKPWMGGDDEAVENNDELDNRWPRMNDRYRHRL